MSRPVPESRTHIACESGPVILSRRKVLKAAGACGCFTLPCLKTLWKHPAPTAEVLNNAVSDELTVLPPRAIQLEGYWDRYLQRSLRHWNKGIVPYAAFVEFFRSGRPFVERRGRTVELGAAGEMWGKAVRSGAL